eukprot:PhF_6_TR35989/c0_g1_i1/m.52111
MDVEGSFSSTLLNSPVQLSLELSMAQMEAQQEYEKFEINTQYVALRNEIMNDEVDEWNALMQGFHSHLAILTEALKKAEILKAEILKASQMKANEENEKESAQPKIAEPLKPENNTTEPSENGAQPVTTENTSEPVKPPVTTENTSEPVKP